MTSSIDPTTIDGTYPVAGQDNDSQGFRDNFTNTQNNFAYAKSELEDLQSKAVLMQPLTGEVVDGTFNNLNEGYPFTGAIISDLVELVYDLGTTSGTIQLSHQTSHYQKITLNNPATVTFATFANGKNCRILLEVNITNVSQTLALDNTVTYYGLDNLENYDASSYTFTFPAVGRYYLQFMSTDGASSVLVQSLDDSLVNSSLFSVDNSSNSNSTTHTVDFTTLGTERTFLTANADITFSYSDTALSGKEAKVFLQNIKGSNINVTLPDILNNLGTNTFAQSNGTVSTLTFTAMDASNANVVCSVIHS